MLQLKSRIKRSKYRYYLQTPTSFIVGSIFKNCNNVLKKNRLIPVSFVLADIMLRRSRFLDIKHIYLNSHLTPPQKCISLNIILTLCKLQNKIHTRKGREMNQSMKKKEVEICETVI